MEQLVTKHLIYACLITNKGKKTTKLFSPGAYYLVETAKKTMENRKIIGNNEKKYKIYT